ncbi:MAG: GNAT family N-acetyltransferase [Anaerolineae bacterium]|nr:GNAT family N-acetyltransferase [Anaerolineae bacterium]
MRAFDPHRDLKPVADLIAVAFSGRLGPDGDIALAEMHRIARWGPLLSWLYWPGASGAKVPPGFVWVEQGRVVGNVSLRRAVGWGGFFIGNMAVHPDWQRRGIASFLMEAALEAVSARGGRWVGLEVQADNQVARRLYEQLSFCEVGRTLHMLRPAGLLWAGNPPFHPALRRGRSRDSADLIELVQAVVPRPHRPLLELRKENYRPGWERALDRWLEGRREAWWVAEENAVLLGAVRALRERGRRPDVLEVLVSPGCSDCLETVLVQRGLASLGRASRKMVETVLPGPTDPLVAALESAGFQKLRVLVQMRLGLSRRIPVRS